MEVISVFFFRIAILFELFLNKYQFLGQKKNHLGLKGIYSHCKKFGIQKNDCKTVITPAPEITNIKLSCF